MTPIEKALQQIKGFTWVQLRMPLIEDYFRTGNPKSLAKIPKSNQGGFWGANLANALALPPQWTEQDRRVIDILCASGIHEYLFEKLNTDLISEPDGEDFHKAYRDQIKGLSSERLALHTGANTRNLLRDGKPTSSARYLTALP